MAVNPPELDDMAGASTVGIYAGAEGYCVCAGEGLHAVVETTARRGHSPDITAIASLTAQGSKWTVDKLHRDVVRYSRD